MLSFSSSSFCKTMQFSLARAFCVESLWIYRPLNEGLLCPNFLLSQQFSEGKKERDGEKKKKKKRRTEGSRSGSWNGKCSLHSPNATPTSHIPNANLSPPTTHTHTHTHVDINTRFSLFVWKSMWLEYFHSMGASFYYK